MMVWFVICLVRGVLLFCCVVVWCIMVRVVVVVWLEIWLVCVIIWCWWKVCWCVIFLSLLMRFCVIWMWVLWCCVECLSVCVLMWMIVILLSCFLSCRMYMMCLVCGSGRNVCSWLCVNLVLVVFLLIYFDWLVGYRLFYRRWYYEREGDVFWYWGYFWMCVCIFVCIVMLFWRCWWWVVLLWAW